MDIAQARMARSNSIMKTLERTSINQVASITDRYNSGENHDYDDGDRLPLRPSASSAVHRFFREFRDLSWRNFFGSDASRELSALCG
ncbi:hypothetical protein HY772_06975 [Candidatus Woesearchaeota archaeon]|nr:hypothetical protein [Candidatus Woesearchaeota archaeon]